MRVKGDLSLFAGTPHQFPIYHSVFAGFSAIAITSLRDSRDDTRPLGGRARRRRSRHARTRCARVPRGYATVASFLCYMLPFSYASMKADTYTDLPSYLSTGAFCGDKGKPQCPSHYLDRLRRQQEKETK